MAGRIITILIVLAANSFLFAEDYTWNNPAGGTFGDENNWTPVGIPGLGGIDNIYFNLPDSYTVTLDDSYSTQKLYIDNSQMTLNLAGFSFAALAPIESGRAVTIADTGPATLRIIYGPVYSREVVIGQQTNSAGNLILDGPEAVWTTMYDENWHGVWIGQDGDANLAILNNAKFYHGHGSSAFGQKSNVNISIDGIDSLWYVDGQFDVSIDGKTTANISNGGMFDVGKLTMALHSNSSAEINLTGQSHQTELIVRNNWENFIIGQRGSAAVKVYGSKILNYGTTIIAENNGSTGLLEIHENSWVDCQNSVAIGGTLANAGGTGQVSIIDANKENSEGVLFTPAHFEGQYVKVWQNGTIYMDGGEITMEYNEGLANPIILQGGRLKGNGMIWAYVQNLGGVVEPYDDLTNKTIEIGYDYTQDAAGTLKISIAGAQTDQYAKLLLMQPNYGNVSLDGMLNVELLSGFVPNYEDQFEIIAAQNITGTFNNAVRQYVFENGSFEVIYNDGGDYDSVVLTHYSPEPSCPKFSQADFNRDCRVNMFDFAVFAEEWLSCGLAPESYCQMN
jgi:hypothetical protein